MVFETGNALLSIELSDPTNFSQIQSKILMTHIIDVKTETEKIKIHFYMFRKEARKKSQ